MGEEVRAAARARVRKAAVLPPPLPPRCCPQLLTLYEAGVVAGWPRGGGSDGVRMCVPRTPCLGRSRCVDGSGGPPSTTGRE